MKNISSPSSISLQKNGVGVKREEGKKTKIVMHLKQKPIAKLNNGLFGFVKVQKNPMVQDSYSRRFMSVDLLSHSFKQKVSISLSGAEATFNCIS